MARRDDPEAKELPKSAKTVTVACKYPPGLLLRVFKMVDQSVPAPGGVRQEKISMQEGAAVQINGPAAPVRQVSPHETAGGFALTHNVDAEFMKTWMEQNADSDVVKNGLIFVASGRNDARDRAEENAGVTTGIEPLDMSTIRKGDVEVVKDPRIGKRYDKDGKLRGSSITSSDHRPAA